MVVSYTCGVLAKAVSDLGITKGARLILSTPHAIISSASPQAIALDASIIACSPLAHSLFTVMPATVTGNPASKADIRATFLLSSPLWLAAPAITSSIAFTSILSLRFSSALITTASKSSGRTPLKAPAYFPTGVLTASITNTSSIHFNFKNERLQFAVQHTKL